MRRTRSQTQAEKAVQDKNTMNSVPTVQAPKRILRKRSTNTNFIDMNKQKKECQDMVNLLRVFELQNILSYCNIPFAGRKVDLQLRIQSLLETNFDLLAPRIKEVYTKALAEQGSVIITSSPEPKNMFSQIQIPAVQQNAGAMVAAGGPVIAAQQLAVNSVGGAAPNPVQGGMFLPAHLPPIHPDISFKKLAFYEELAILIQPSSLLPRNAQRIQEMPFYFTLTPAQATDIATNRDIRNANKAEYNVQVQLRFCMLETSCPQEDCFPPNVSVKVNNKVCQLPNVIPTNRPNVEPKRPPRPVNITPNVKLSPMVTNTITIQWCPDYTRGYCIAVYIVRKLSSVQLLNRMKTKGVKPADYTRALIKEKLTEDADCEIATTMLKVSLICPLGKMKMSIPCRASTCSHLQCFDASLYLQMNERKPTWNCPVCDKPAIFDSLVIDGYFQEVLASSLLQSEDTEIQLHKDGSWSTHNLRNETQVLDTPAKTKEKVEVISDDIELITTEDIKSVNINITSAVSNDQPTSTTNNETVDLTLSDSDDDLPLAKRRPTGKQNAVVSSTNSSPGLNGGTQRGMYLTPKNAKAQQIDTVVEDDEQVKVEHSLEVNLSPINNNECTNSSITSTTKVHKSIYNNSYNNDENCA